MNANILNKDTHINLPALGLRNGLDLGKSDEL